MPVTAYTRGIEAITSGALNLGSVTVRAMLTTASYVEDKALHQFRSQVTSNEVAPGAGYSTGGVNVPFSVTRDDATNRVEIMLGSPSWTAPSGQTLTARKLVYYVSTGNAGTDRLLAVNDFGSNQSATNQTLNVAASVIRLQN